MSGHGGSWQRVLDRALLLGCALWIALQTTNTLVALGRAVEPAAIAALATALVARAVLIGLCLYAARSGVTRPLAAGGLVVGAVAVLAAGSLTVMDVDLGRAVELMVPTDAIQAVQIFAVATAVRFRTALWTIAATFPVHLALRLSGGISGDEVEQWVTPTSATLALAALVVYLRSGSVYAEQLDAWNRDARREAASLASHDLAVAEARRVIHDDVISALRGIAQDAPWDAVEPAVRAALASLESARDCATLDELLVALEETPGLDVTLAGELWPDDPPPRVVEAFRGAAAEALRNVARHSGTTAATVTARMAGRTVVLEVADAGRGFDVRRAGGFGLPHSIVARVEQVGGRAAVASAPGRGTAVTLEWTPPEPPPTEQITPYASDQRWRGYLPVALAITANSSFLAWRHPGPHEVAALTLAALMTAVLPVAAWWFAFRPPAPRDALLVAAFVCLVTWVGLGLAGNGALLDMRSWIVGFAASLSMLLAFDGRPRHLLIPVCSQIAVCLWFAWRDPTIALLDPIGALTTPIVICGFSSLFGALLRRGTHLIRQGEATLAARVEELAWQDAREQARRVHLETLRADVAPYLREVLAAGEPALASADVRLRASVLSARCRDDLLLPQALPDGVRRVVDAARASGATVSFRVDGEQRQEWPAELNSVLSVVLRKTSPEVVTVIADGTPRIVVLPALGRGAVVRVLKLVGGLVHVSGGEVRTVFELSSDVPSSAAAPQPASLGA